MKDLKENLLKKLISQQSTEEIIEKNSVIISHNFAHSKP